MNKAFVGVVLVVLAGCVHTPDPDVHNRVDPSKDDGFGSMDVVTVANKIGPEILHSDLLAGTDRELLIAVSPIRGGVPLGFDSNLFLRRLRLELNRHSKGRMRFLSQAAMPNAVRDMMRDDAKGARIQSLMEDVARGICGLQEFRGGVFAVIPAFNTNFVNLNADSYLASLRAKIVTMSNRDIKFTMPGRLEGASYYLTGQFIADSDKTEGMINLVDYIKDLEKAEREGKDILEIRRVEERSTEYRTSQAVDERKDFRNRFIVRPRLQKEAQDNERLRSGPRVAKYLNVMVVNASSKVACFEQQVSIEDVSSGIGNADYILSAEVSDVQKKDSGYRYYLVTIQLTDPRSNVMVWEDGCEMKVFEGKGK